MAVTAGIDLGAITRHLERAGVQAFCDSYQELLDVIEGKLAVGAADAAETAGLVAAA